MIFEDFARYHGLIINSVIPFKWVSTPTEDHPRKRNGRYKYMGDVAWVQNWATMEKPVMWRTDRENTLSPNFIKARDHASTDRDRLAVKASAKAGWIMHQTQAKEHPYLVAKGFVDEKMPVWESDGKKLLVVAMRKDSCMVGCQLIDDEGGKKFLYGQVTKGASFIMDAKGTPIFCEGLATGLSIQAVMRANKMRYAIYVCFSASNMKEVSRAINGGIIVADNDPSSVGERIAKETGKPYWLSDTVGEDFNDYHVRVGIFKASQSLKKTLLSFPSKTLPQSA